MARTSFVKTFMKHKASMWVQKVYCILLRTCPYRGASRYPQLGCIPRYYVASLMMILMKQLIEWRWVIALARSWFIFMTLLVRLNVTAFYKTFFLYWGTVPIDMSIEFVNVRDEIPEETTSRRNWCLFCCLPSARRRYHQPVSPLLCQVSSNFGFFNVHSL